MRDTADVSKDTLPEPLVLRLPAVGRLLSVSRRTVSNLIRDGELETIPVGSIRMVTRASIDAYIDRQRGKQTPVVGEHLHPVARPAPVGGAADQEAPFPPAPSRSGRAA